MIITQVSRYAPKVGQCIYCGTANDHLGNEHAIPYGINGPWVLLEASCHKCADITHRLERDTSKGLLKSFRTILGMQSHRQKHDSLNWPFVIKKGDTQKNPQIALDACPLYLPVPILPPPGILGGLPLSASSAVGISFSGSSFEEVSHCYDRSLTENHYVFDPMCFMRTIAKIAYCAAIYTLGIAPFKGAPIRRAILGEDPCIGYWVGAWAGEQVNETKGLHAMQVRMENSNVHVILRLFAQFNTPEYHVIFPINAYKNNS